jgi:hypothetical protein
MRCWATGLPAVQPPSPPKPASTVSALATPQQRRGGRSFSRAPYGEYSWVWRGLLALAPAPRARVAEGWRPLSLATRREISGRPASNHSYPIRDGLALNRGKQIVGVGEHNVMIPAARVGVMSCPVPAFASLPPVSFQAFSLRFDVFCHAKYNDKEDRRFRAAFCLPAIAGLVTLRELAKPEASHPQTP